MMQGGAESVPLLVIRSSLEKSEWGIFFFSFLLFLNMSFLKIIKESMSTERGSNHGCHLSFVRMWRARQKAEDR